MSIEDELLKPMLNSERNVLIEEMQRREREKAERGEIANGSTESDCSEPSANQTENEASNVTTDVSAAGVKKSGNKNALRHGGYSQGILPWESPEEFEALHKGLKEGWKPVGILQEEAVLTLCQWMWKRRRVILASEISYFRSPVPEGLKTGELRWDDVVAYQCNVPAQVEEYIRAQIKLADGLSKLSDKIGKHHYWTDTTEGKDIQLQLSTLKSDVNTLAAKVRDRVLGRTQDIRTAVEKITNLFDEVYQPDEIEKQARLLAMIDREIDRSTKRLILLQTYANELAPQSNAQSQPLLESPPVVPGDPPTA